ncbi:MAG: leucine-rich repeat domain-containing protein [Ruminococcaceae bacterium]|nr:leucine-rich repeat domain-containing protein [Oscillospiraceae bacterium]
MTKSLKKFACGILLVAIFAMTVLTAVADYSGTDTNISWTLDTSNGVLTISGSGAMPTYAKGSAPWYQYKAGVKSIVVQNGVIVSQGAFYGMENLNKISLPYVGNGSTATYFGYVFGAENYFQNETYVPASLKTVEITGSTAIAAYAFNNVSGVEKIVIADTVTTIGECAFKDCSSAKYIVLGSGTTSVGKNAFQRCDSIVYTFFNGTSTGWTNVTVDATNSISPVFLGAGTLAVTPATKTAYSLSEKLDLTGMKVTFAEVDVTENVEVIAPDMTTIGTKLVQVVFGNKSAYFNITVSSNGESGVSGVLTWSVNAAAGTLTISGNGMMDNYTLETMAPWYAYRNSITTVNVSEGVTSVGAYAFYGLTKVTAITLPATVESVDYAAFENCSALSNLTIANTSAVVDGTAFRNCTALYATSGNATYAKVSGNANYALISVDKTATSFTIPATTVVIAEGAFENSVITTVTVPDSVITVGDSAFASAALTSATLGAGVKYIGNYAFVDCASLSEITFNAVPNFVGAGAFAATKVAGTVSNGAVYLGTADNAYAILWKAEDTECTSVAVNASTKVIASLAFANCKALEAVQLPEGLLHIGDSAFNTCTALYSVQMPSTLLTVGDAAFKGCTALANVDFSESLEIIGNSAFRGTAITTAVIGASVENVGYNAFRDCTALKTLVYNAGGIGYKTFANCTSLSEVYLADTVLSLGEYAFSGCAALKTVAIPDTTGTIEFGALYGCDAIENIALPYVGEKANGTNKSFAYIFGMTAPKSLNMVLIGSNIPDNAFDGIESIETLIIDKTTTTIGTSAFDVAPAKVYYLGSAEEWSRVTNSASLSNVEFANSEFDLDSLKETYEPGEVLDRVNFVATLGTTDVTALLRFVSNPVTSEAPVLPAKLGSLVQNFKAQIIKDVEFTNYSLLLEGSIGVKFYVKLSEFIIDDIDNTKATVDYYGSTHDVELVKAENTVDGALYTVKFYVAAKEMNQPITLIITTPNVTESITRTVKDYVDYVNENPADYASCITLINEMYNYGEYSRSYFEKAEITPNPDLSNVEVTISNSYTPIKKGNVSGITLNSSSLLLESNTTVRHYFKLADGASISDYTFTVNGARVTPVEKDGLYYIEVNNIIARSLGKLDKTVVSSATESMTITYSPLSYVKLALENRAESDPALANLVKALYKYYVAASDYFADITDEVEPSEDESKPSIW